MKYANKDKVKNLCSQIEKIEKKIDDLQTLKTSGYLHIMAEKSHTSVDVFLGQETADWIVSRAILKYKGMLLELNAELEKL
jgi:Ribonuclease G/E